jgi:hypothetical protein
MIDRERERERDAFIESLFLSVLGKRRRLAFQRRREKELDSTERRSDGLNEHKGGGQYYI